MIGPSLGWLAIEWIERYVPHGPGDIEGLPWRLDDEEARLLLKMYALDQDGHRRVDETLYSRPKGRRKTDLAGALICFEALGPARFERWGRGRAPIGRKVTFPFVRILATEEGQATETAYNTARYQLEQMVAAPSGEFGGVDVGLTRAFLPGGGEIRPCAAKGASKDGGKESFVVAEETHLYTTAELRLMYATVKRNLTKRPIAEPHLLQCSTMYGPGQASIAEVTHRAAEVGTARLLLDHRQASRVPDFADTDGLVTALEEAYGDAADWALAGTNLDRILAHIRDPRTEIADTVRYYLGRPHAVAGGWLAAGVWSARFMNREPPGDGARVCVGFDGARTRDATALVAVEVDTGYVWPLAIWEAPAGEEWEVPRDEVETALELAVERFEVLRVYADPPWWETTVDEWAGRWPNVVYRWYTNRYQRMAHATRACTNAVDAGELSHNGDPTLERHVGNARRRPTSVRDPDTGAPMYVLAKEHHHSARSVDGAVALVLAWEARRDAIAAGALRPEPPKPTYATVGFR